MTRTSSADPASPATPSPATFAKQPLLNTGECGNTPPAALMAPVPPAVKKFGVVLCGAALFFSIASVLEPHRSTAHTLPPNPNPPESIIHQTPASRAILPAAPADASLITPLQAPATDPAGRRHLGSLVGADLTVWIYSDQHGPLYTVLDPAGRILAQSIPAAEVDKRFPSLGLSDMLGRAPEQSGTRLMLVDPGN